MWKIIISLESMQLSNIQDSWCWEIDIEDVFVVKEAYMDLDRLRLQLGDIERRWNRFLSFKINIFGDCCWIVFLLEIIWIEEGLSLILLYARRDNKRFMM